MKKSLLCLMLSMFMSFGILTSKDINDLRKIFLDMEIIETPDIIFNRIVDIGTDDNANIYVLDSKEKTIYIFREDGKFINKIGRPGNGPGEFEKPCSISIDTKGNKYVLDEGNRRIEVFNNKNIYTKSIKILVFPGGSLKRIAVNSSGELYISGSFKKENIKYPIAKYSSNGGFIKYISLPIIEYDFLKLSDQDKERVSEYLSGGSVCIFKNNQILFSHSWPYVIEIVSENESYIQINRKTEFNWIPIIFKTDRINGILFGEFTQTKKIFLLGDFIVNSISIINWEGDPKKEISSMVFASNPEKYINIKERYCVLDIYSNEMKYTASAEIPGNINILTADKKGRLLGVRYKEDGGQKIERYKINFYEKECLK